MRCDATAAVTRVKIVAVVTFIVDALCTGRLAYSLSACSMLRMSPPEEDAVQVSIHEDGAMCSSERGQSPADADGWGAAAGGGTVGNTGVDGLLQGACAVHLLLLLMLMLLFLPRQHTELDARAFSAVVVDVLVICRIKATGVDMD